MGLGAQFRLVSVDVGNTILGSRSPGLASRLLRRCANDHRRAILRDALLTRRLNETELLRWARPELRAEGIQPDQLAPMEPYFLDGAEDALRSLMDVFTVVTISNTTSLDIRQRDPVSAAFPLLPRYRSCEIGIAKPDPDIFAYVSRRHGISAHCAVHIGDDWTCDVVGATAAGWKAIYVHPDAAEPGAVAGMIASVLSLRDAVEMLTEWGSG
jgi:FMN hydrolase / 5-amino-6-(5-phospho-D-ribitylamino)uracil phosphatase